jgi:hypothetical protein
MERDETLDLIIFNPTQQLCRCVPEAQRAFAFHKRKRPALFKDETVRSKKPSALMLLDAINDLSDAYHPTRLKL